ncbi:hypothetical protein [Kingella oralis]|uniref:hypothetical protein n=1 Tax=Kingella oralis TaxID=505 RepID=UPI0034E55CDF
MLARCRFSGCLNLHKLQDWQSQTPPAGICPAFPPSPIPEPNKTRYHLIIRRYREPPMSKPQTPSP